MTTAADDSAVEDAFEALLAGRPAPQGQAGLAAFTEAVRASATRPGRPHAALAELLATGLLADQSSPSVRTATPAGSPPARPSRVRTRRRTAMIFPVLLAKFLSAGAIAQAATGAGLVLVVATGAGATGVLGEDVQRSVTGVVALTSDETTGDDTGTTDGTTTTDSTDTTDTTIEPAPLLEEGTEPVEGEFRAESWTAGPAEGQSFGEWVSMAARNKGALETERVDFSHWVRHWAHNKGLDEAELAEEGVNLDDLTDAPAETGGDVQSDVVSETERPAVAATTEARGSRGSGNAGGAGKAVAGTVDGAGKVGPSANGGGNGRGNG